MVTTGKRAKPIRRVRSTLKEILWELGRMATKKTEEGQVTVRFDIMERDRPYELGYADGRVETFRGYKEIEERFGAKDWRSRAGGMG